MTLTPAGRVWIESFPTERTTAGLVQPFRRRVQAFITELEKRGCTVRITATRRPEQRAWLMHYAWRIARDGWSVSSVPTRADIPISWTKEGAEEMVRAYGMVVRASLTSHHVRGQAIDMVVDGWTAGERALRDLGASFMVYNLPGDPVHWSVDGK